MFLVAEDFLSINGEGLNAGMLAHFIRLAGCPLRCDYCDTAWAQTEKAGKTTALEAIIEKLNASPAAFVTLTGGEPLAAAGIEKLIAAILEETDKILEIETSGAIALEPFLAMFGDSDRLHFTVDYKLASSGMTSRMIQENYHSLRTGDVIKYVIGGEEDLEMAIQHHMAWLGTQRNQMGSEDNHRHVGATPIFSPVFGKIEPSQMVEAVKDNCLFLVRIQLQLHKYIWEPTLQGV